MDLKLEVVVVPVADVDRAKDFYQGLGWRLDADFPFDNGFRVVQFTPPGSGCSIQFGTNITSAAPGSAEGLYLIVSDINAARGELAALGAKVSEVFHAGTPGAQFQPDGASGRVSGPAPDHGSYGSFATFSDPDGNGWLLQEITHPPARADRPRLDFVRFRKRSGERDATRVDRSRRAREAHRRGRRELARLVRPVHGGGAGRDGTADVSEGVTTASSCRSMFPHPRSPAAPEPRRGAPQRCSRRSSSSWWIRSRATATAMSRTSSSPGATSTP